ncbi:MAG: 2-succinyl-5-enolpyruvyl-6-hydroxy-3-cyclohexene-1-carboxylic-acid synthase [Crocinitomicaceae bacterium]
MKTTKITHIAHLVEIAVKHGLRKVVISPGSRNAPLVIAFDAHPKIETYLVHDERSAAFMALGMAEESGHPVAVTCTSGSAPANYTPAITEAYYRQIPLLILTADRPSDLIDHGDGQTIRQKGMFSNFIKNQFQLPDSPKNDQIKESDEMINLAFQDLIETPCGPVHINIPLAEPLYELTEEPIDPMIIPVETPNKKLKNDQISELVDIWSKAEKKLIIIGQASPKHFSIEEWQPILADPCVAVLVENTANFIHFERFCHAIDRTLALIHPDEIEKYRPDLLISMGGAIISKRIKAFFRKNKPKWNWRVGSFLIQEDTYKSLTHFLDAQPSELIRCIGQANIPTLSNYGSQWKQLDFIAMDRMEGFLMSADFSDLKAFELILDTIPDGANIHMANSSVVRYCQLFNPVRGMRYYSNRGVSGIDGSTSTALGIAIESPQRLNVLISGDVSFLYDSNAIWNKYLPSNFRIIVISNGGGGIFKIIDGPKTTAQLDYFFAETEVDLGALCKAYGLKHISVESEIDFMSACPDFYADIHDKPVVMEVKTKGIQNDAILKQYFTAIKGEV